MLLVTAAFAHVGDVIGGVDVSVRRQEDVTEAPPAAVIEGNFGLLLPSGASWQWVCHEAVTAPAVVVSPRYARSAAGVTLAFLEDPADGRDGQTLFRSVDGCDWPLVDALADRVVPSATFDPADPLVAWAVTADPGEDNGIWRSADAGATFAPARPLSSDRRFLSFALGSGEAWATATDEAGGRLFLWHATGDEWAEHELVGVPSVVAATDLRVLAAGEAGEVWLVVDPFGPDIALRAFADGTWTVAYDGGGWINDGAWDGERLWLVRDATTLTSITLDGAIADHPAFPAGTNVTFVEGALWTAPASYLVYAMLARSDDGGETFTTLAYPDDVSAPLSCPAESDAATVCDPLWDTLLPRVRGFDDPPAETADTGSAPIPPHRDPEAPGCGCAGGAGSAGGLFLPVLLLAGRWRRS